jgi:uncharacterized protein YwgA
MFKELVRKSFLLQLVEKMQYAKSWTGETHIQKTIYFLQKLFNVPLEYKYIFYKHGPFSFELRDELTELRADKILNLKSKEPYGATFLPGNHAEILKEKYGEKAKDYYKQMKFVAVEISNRSVRDLEKLSTALYVYKEENIFDSEKITDRIIELKPHITKHEAEETVEEFFDLEENVEGNNLIVH